MALLMLPMLLGCFGSGRDENGAAQPEETSRGSPLGEVASPADEGAQVWFRDVTKESGVDFEHVSGIAEDKPFPAANGSGVGLLDFDGDGLMDLYFATGTSFPLDADVPRPSNRIYRNLGNWRFVDVTSRTGAGHEAFSAGVAAADYNNDGFTDLYVTCFGRNVLYSNQGDGTFRKAEAAAAQDDRWATSAAFLDADGDGVLDLYVCNYAKWDYASNAYCGDRVRNVRLFCSPNSVEAEADVFLRGNGDGTFVDANASIQTKGQSGRGQGVIAADLNADGWIDLYVGNDLHPNFLFTNNGDGSFSDMTELSGAGYDNKGDMQAGMGVEVEDVDDDGYPELFVTNFRAEQNTLYQNNGKAMFADASSRFGLSAASLPYVGWGTAFGDFDLDGEPDLAVTNGHVDDNRHLLGQDAPYAVPPLLWRHDGARFALISAPAGNYFAKKHVGRGLASGDLDNDGDEDLVITHQDARPALLMNEAPSSDSHLRAISVRLVGVRSNRNAIGASLTLNCSAGADAKRLPLTEGEGTRVSRTKTQQIKGGGSYLSARDLRQVFAVLPDETEISLDVRWPNREETTVSGLAPGGHYLIIEAPAPHGEPTVFEIGDHHE